MELLTTLFSVSLGAILVNNFIFAQFLGICPFMGVSKKVDTALGMGVAVIFVMGVASAVCWPINNYILIPNKLVFMQTVTYILVIASLVQFVEMFLQKAVPTLYQALGVYLPLIVVNCIILGRAELFASKNPVLDSALDGLGMGLGFTLTLVIMGSIREILGMGTFFGLQVLPEGLDTMAIFSSPPGGFFVFGILMAAAIFIEAKTGHKKERSVGCAGCAGCPSAQQCENAQEGGT